MHAEKQLEQQLLEDNSLKNQIKLTETDMEEAADQETITTKS